jgi:hypothetical protein
VTPAQILAVPVGPELDRIVAAKLMRIPADEPPPPFSTDPAAASAIHVEMLERGYEFVEGKHGCYFVRAGAASEPKPHRLPWPDDLKEEAAAICRAALIAEALHGHG